MGKKCKLKDSLSCDGSSTVSCSAISQLESANPDATFTCLGVNGKKESVQCEIDGSTSEFTGKVKKLLKWAVSDSCISNNGGGGGGAESCACEAEVANEDLYDVYCVGDNTYECADFWGGYSTFTAKKCKKIGKAVAKVDCATNDKPPSTDEPKTTDDSKTTNEPGTTKEPGTTQEPTTGTTDCKILCLHGGGDSAAGLQGQPGMQDLMAAVPECTFVFVDSPEDGLWMQDPPSKDQPTTDPTWADVSINFIDGVVANQGPFYGILGYSQGSAFIPVYLAFRGQNTFERAFMYNGYLPETHQGLMDQVNQESPFTIPAMVFSGENDVFGPMAAAQAAAFTGVEHIHSADAGHHLPDSSDSTFQNTVDFIKAGSASWN